MKEIIKYCKMFKGYEKVKLNVMIVFVVREKTLFFSNIEMYM
jgi:hypothetical protein